MNKSPELFQITIAEIAELVGADYFGDGNCIINSIATLQSAEIGQASFLDNSKYRKFLPNTKASLVILKEDNAHLCRTNYITCSNPYYAYALLSQKFKPSVNIVSGIHGTATIGENCKIDPSASIGAYCVLGDNVVIEKNAVISAHCNIGSGSIIGAATYLWSKVVLYHDVKIGERCEIHSGVVIGADGFGFARGHDGWKKVAQLGSVVIGNDVDIGANTTIDRGAIQNTIIEDGVKLDNQIQIGHNCHIGAHTIIAGCVGIAGSTVIGKNCMIGGGACLVGHISIADNVIITGMTGVSKSIKESGIYSSGIPADQMHNWKRNVVYFRHFSDLVDRIKKLEEFTAKIDCKQTIS